MRIGLCLSLVLPIIFAASHAYNIPAKSFVSSFNLDSININIGNRDTFELTVIISAGYNDTCTKHEDCDAENNMECDMLGVCRCLNDYKWIDKTCSKNNIDVASAVLWLVYIGIIALIIGATLITYCFASFVAETPCYKSFCRSFCCCCCVDDEAGALPIPMGFRDLSELNESDVVPVMPLSVNLPVTIDVSVPPMHLTVNISAPTVIEEDQPPNYDDLPPPFPQSPPPDYGAINIDFPRETENS